MSAQKVKAVEAAWLGYRKMCVPANAPAVQVEECHRAFFAGAAVLFESLLKIMDPGPEPTESDMERMTMIHDELRAFGRGLDAELLGGATRKPT